MNQANWRSGILGCLGILAQGTEAIAAPVVPSENPAASTSSVTNQSLRLAQIPSPIAPPSLIAPVMLDADPMAQVRSVESLSDVRPTDWAYTAVRSLVERYGILLGLSDGTFRGDRPLTRFEMLGALNRVLEQVEQRFATGEIAQLREDVTTIRRLLASYGEIAKDLRDRLNQLDQTVAQLTQQQFSTTTKLSGQVVGVLTDGSDARTTIIDRVRLNLQTSFTGQDRLLTQLETGNDGGDAISNAQNRNQNLLGTAGLLADGGGLDYVAFPNTLRLSKLYYTFQPVGNLSFTVGARLAPRDFIDYNRFANESATNFSSSFFANNPLIVQNPIDRPSGAGAVVTWQPSDRLTLRALYVATNAEDPTSGILAGGLFGDRNQGSVEVEYAFQRNLVVRLQYTRATVNNTDVSAGGINAEWAINPLFGVFGRVGIARYDGFNPVLNQDLDLRPKTWAIGLTFRRIVIPGSTAGFAVGQPFVENDLGNATQTNFELYYSFLLNDSISFTPNLMLVTNPNNRRSDTIFQGAVRLVFSF